MAIIGKNIIENLTTGMYENPLIIYREYIQNSADSIDSAIKRGLLDKKDAEICIDIDENERKITIHDNGVGIPAKQFKAIMSSIADSTKDRAEDKGFRGIGRLGGISSCEKLIFTCSAQGEEILSTCEWDAFKLKNVLNDKTQHPSATELVDAVTRYSQKSCSADEHFFKVELIGVGKAFANLLNEEKVRQYLESVAPLPYKKGFYLSGEIYRFAREHGFKIDEYNVYLNGDLLYKPYNMRFFIKDGNGYKSYDELESIDTKIFTSDSGEILAWMWYGICKFEKQIPKNGENIMRGIRLRKGNLQIGDENVFNKLYKEPRGPLYFVGEVFAVSPNLIPNARRDYFNTDETCNEFEEKLRPLFYDRFYQIYHKANEYKKAYQKSTESKNIENLFQKKLKEGQFIDEADRLREEETVKKKKEEAEKAQRIINVREKNDADDDVLGRIYSTLKKEYDIPKTNEAAKTEKDTEILAKPKKKYKTQGLSKYSKKEQKLIGRIYSVINSILPPEQSEAVIDKIQEELAK